MSDMPAPLSWEERYNTVSTMPGPGTGFLDVLRKTCSWIIESPLSSEVLAHKLRDDSPRNLKFAHKYVAFLKRAGLVKQDGDILRLPESMRRWVETKDNSIPIKIIHRNTRFIGELLAEVEEEPKALDELLEVAKKYRFEWKQETLEQQVKRRCKWLMSAGMIMLGNGGNRLGKNTSLKLTPSGRELLKTLDVYEPDVPIFDYDELERKTREERRKFKPGSPPPDGVKKPEGKERTIIQYARCPKIRAWVLEQASGVCELCSNKAPFVKEDDTPFLEIHHIEQLSQGGADTHENTVALCPNCHRHLHYGKDRSRKKQELRNIIKTRAHPRSEIIDTNTTQ